MTTNNDTYEKVKKLLRQRAGISVTNVCNLTCGACYAQVGKFPKEKHWFISVDEFEEKIEYLVNYMYAGTTTLKNGEVVQVNPNNYELAIMGGEPTVHPEFEKLWGVLKQKKYHDVKFWIFTNGRQELPPVPNIFCRVNYKTKTVGFPFTPQLVAPIDIFPDKDHSYFWQIAQTDCPNWWDTQCNNPIYKNKISFCCAATGWMDLLDIDLGWDLPLNKNPFSCLTDADIDAKANSICYRCGWSKYMSLPEEQRSEKYDLVSESNLEVLLQNEKSKPYKFVWLDNGIVRLSDLKYSHSDPNKFLLSLL